MSKMHSSHRMETPFQSSLLDSIPFLINHGIGRPTWLAELCEAPIKLKTSVETQAEKAREWLNEKKVSKRSKWQGYQKILDPTDELTAISAWPVKVKTMPWKAIQIHTVYNSSGLNVYNVGMPPGMHCHPLTHMLIQRKHRWRPLRATAIELTASGMDVAAARKVKPEIIVGISRILLCKTNCFKSRWWVYFLPCCMAHKLKCKCKNATRIGSKAYTSISHKVLQWFEAIFTCKPSIWGPNPNNWSYLSQRATPAPTHNTSPAKCTFCCPWCNLCPPNKEECKTTNPKQGESEGHHIQFGSFWRPGPQLL